MSASCPIGDCSYSGAPASVEAHLSGSTIGEHAGKLGQDFREAIRGEGSSSRSEGGLPIGLSAKQLALLAGLVLVLLLAWRATRGNDPPESQDVDDDEEPTEGDPEGGLAEANQDGFNAVEMREA